MPPARDHEKLGKKRKDAAPVPDEGRVRSAAMLQVRDIVEIFVNGTSYGRILLSNAGQDVLIPLPAGTNAQVHVLAVQDGGGGVTFGVTTSQGEIRSTVMPEGGSDDWSVTIQ